MFNWWRAKQQTNVALVFAFTKEQVSLVIADVTHAEPVLIVSDHCSIADGQWTVGIQTLAQRYEKQMKWLDQVHQTAERRCCSSHDSHPHH